MSTRPKQSDRVNVRVDAATKKRLLRASKAAGQSLTDFILTAALTSADDALAARTNFILSPKDWRKFNDLLDSPPREILRLKRLFKEKSLFEK